MVDSERGIAGAERVVLIDALRGFALLGILLANSLYWSGWDFMSPERSAALVGAAASERLWFWHKLLIDGKFYTIFSMLFGLGFALQLAWLEARGADGRRIYRRRVMVLLGIGLVHLLFVWDGDILTLYALLGLLLPLFRRLSDRAVLAWSAGCLLLPLAAAPAFAALGWQPWNVLFGLAAAISPQFGTIFADPVAWLQRPDWGSFAAWKSIGWLMRTYMILDSWRVPKVLGMMLLGLWLGRRLIAGRLLDDRRLLWGALGGGLLIGLPASYAYAVADGISQNHLGAMIGTAPLGIAYAAGFALAWRHAAPLLGLLAAPGRMALTNYLAQTLLGSAIYLGIGLGLAGHVGAATIYPIAAAIFALQILWSHLWLRRFAQGPMEWLWRRLTYAGGTRRPATTLAA